MKPVISVKTASTEAAILDGLKSLQKKQVYVGIPATTAEERNDQVAKILSSKKVPKRFARRKLSLGGQINNAELVYIHTYGSSKMNIPARPIIEAAITEETNKEAIAEELKLAGVEAENRVKGWFTNPKNGWAPNSPRTVRRKGSSRPLIDTGALRQAIRSVVVEEE